MEGEIERKREGEGQRVGERETKKNLSFFIIHHFMELEFNVSR